jgi:hypothetical protein
MPPERECSFSQSLSMNYAVRHFGILEPAPGEDRRIVSSKCPSGLDEHVPAGGPLHRGQSRSDELVLDMYCFALFTYSQIVPA